MDFDQFFSFTFIDTRHEYVSDAQSIVDRGTEQRWQLEIGQEW